MSLSEHDAVQRALALGLAHQEYLSQRIQAQLSFADELVARTPAKRTRWAPLIRRARALITGATPGALEQAVHDAERLLAPLSPAAKQFTVHCVGHAHIDMNWLWSWPETVSITCDTFATVLKLMDEFPDFCFSQSQASVYEIAHAYQPELLDGIRRRIAEGRWEVTAVHWVEGDKNIACGESMARHMLYTRRFMQEHLGLTPEDVPLDWECDMFGHAHTIPTILAKGRARRYYMCRAGAPEKPPVFWWQGPDGARVIVVKDITGYNDHIGAHIVTPLLSFYDRTGMKDWMEVYGVGDHGGGPTRRDILRAHDMHAWPVFPRVLLTTTRRFYELLEARPGAWPVLDQEINFVFAGCYTSQSLIKQMNRLGENYCLEAETVAAIAGRTVSFPYPHAQLREAWINVLFGQFHDILPGSGIHWTREYQSGLFQNTAATTHMIKTQALRALAAAIDTSHAGTEPAPRAPGRESAALGAGVGRGAMHGALSCASRVLDGPCPVVVFNTLAAARREVVQATIWDDGAHSAAGAHYLVRPPSGADIPAQIINKGHYWGHDFVDLVFPADIAPLGYAAFGIAEGRADVPPGAVRVYEAPPRHDGEMPSTPAMENEYLQVEFDPATGGVCVLRDKRTGLNIADARHPLGILDFAYERPRGMSAWIIAETGERQTRFDIASMKVTHRGPYLAALQTILRVAQSQVAITYTLKAGSPALEITVETTWLERGSSERGTPTLRMRFPFALTGARARYEIPFGSVARALNQGQEVPALRWASVTGRQGRARAGCAVLNDSKHGYALDGSMLSLTLIRASYDPDPLPEFREHTMRMAVVPHAAQAPIATLVHLGAAFNHPLQVVNTDVHDGALPARLQGVRIAQDNIVLTSLRQAHDGGGLVAHLLETQGRPTRATVAFAPELFGRVTTAREIDFLEQPAPASQARRAGNGFTVPVPAHGIACVQLT